MSTLANAVLAGCRASIVSRCSQTLFRFRRSLIESLTSSGVETKALGAAGDGYEKRLNDAGIDFQHIPVSHRGIDPFEDARLVASLYAHFRRFRPHFVHAFTAKPAVYATIAAAMARVPVRVVTITGLGHAFTSAAPIVRATVEALYRFALSQADLVFFQNPDDRSLFVERGLVRFETTALIPGSGVDLERFSAVPLPHKTAGAPAFLMIARLLREKGVVEFIAASQTVKAKHPDVDISLLGAVDRRNPSSLSEAEIEALRRSNAVTWIDEVDDVRPYIADSDVVVLPSYREGVPRSLLEGAAMGRALVATDTAGCREVVDDGKTGWLVPIRDSSSLAGAMLRLVGRPEDIRIFGTNARTLVESRFDERHLIGECLAAYTRLLSRV